MGEGEGGEKRIFVGMALIGHDILVACCVTSHVPIRILSISSQWMMAACKCILLRESTA